MAPAAAQAFGRAFDALTARIAGLGVRVDLEPMDVETPGRFDGPSITINTRHDPEARCYFLAHSFGSIVLWSTAFDEAAGLFGELRAAKEAGDRERLERAIGRFAAFEESASAHAVWLLSEAGFGEMVPGYTTFFRADLEAMVQFHRDGVAPEWPAFFSEYRAQVARGERGVRPYEARRIPPFRPKRIPEQEVVQERDGKQ